jgi:hypothetical protein
MLYLLYVLARIVAMMFRLIPVAQAGAGPLIVWWLYCSVMGDHVYVTI